ncbi:MAG TPA: alpha/beta hydrolase [Vulgatibacter sp.]|nr:alpha/beta hydrolase [Vulgatibacter sp.]
MKERVEAFGPRRGLTGILTEPRSAGIANAPAILLTNVGIQTRVGPGRIWVELARRLAASGFPVLRFDLSGMGDSAVRIGGASESERAVLDMRDAMDHLERKHGVRQFVVIGFCSGTDVAHGVALADPRVAGMIWIEGYAYRTRRFLVRWYMTRLLSLRRWRRYARSVLARLRLTAEQQRGIGEEDRIFRRDYPTPELLSRQLEELVHRGVQILAVYSGGANPTYGYGGQFFEMLPGDFRGHIDEIFVPEADHLFSVLDHRRTLVERLAVWIEERFGEKQSLRTGT